MHRIDNTTAAPTFPAPKPIGTGGYFTAGAPGGPPPTIVEYDWLNTVQEELANVVSNAGVALDKTNNAQLLLALRTIFPQRSDFVITAATPGRLVMPGGLTIQWFGAGTPFSSGVAVDLYVPLPWAYPNNHLLAMAFFCGGNGTPPVALPPPNVPMIATSPWYNANVRIAISASGITGTYGLGVISIGN